MPGKHTTMIALLSLAVATATVQAASSGKKPLYRWVDEEGRVHYGDRVPPSDAKQGRETIGAQGTVTKVLPRELSGKELEAEQQRLAEEKAAEDARQQRIAYDRYLVQSFASVGELQSAREQRLGALDARITLTQQAIVENEKTLAELRSRTGNKAPEGALKQQIETFENSLIDNLQAVRKLRDERQATQEKFTRDIERFKGLKAGTIRRGD